MTIRATEKQSPDITIQTDEVDERQSFPLKATRADGNQTLQASLTVHPDSMADLRELANQARDLGLPISWNEDLPQKSRGWWVVRKILGLAITIVAVSLGAPFWFDILNRFVSLRSSQRIPTRSEQDDTKKKSDASN